MLIFLAVTGLSGKCWLFSATLPIMALPRVSGAWGRPRKIKPATSSFHDIRGMPTSGHRNLTDMWLRSEDRPGLVMKATIIRRRKGEYRGIPLACRRRGSDRRRDGHDRLCPHHASPSMIKLKPRPSIIPLTTGLAVIFSIHVTRRERHQCQKMPVKIPAPQIIPGVVVLAWAMAIPPIASWLDRHRRPEIEPGKDLEHPQGHKDPKGVPSVEGMYPRRRAKRPQVSEAPANSAYRNRCQEFSFIALFIHVTIGGTGNQEKEDIAASCLPRAMAGQGAKSKLK